MTAIARTPSERPTILPPPAIKSLLDIVQQRIEPVEVWLFGSRARGEDRPDSDWDLLAVVGDDSHIDVDDPVLSWRIAKDSGVASTLLVTRKSDLEDVWGQVNTLGYELARDGLRIDVR
jgi:predicted nucleotidyltransferase